MRRATVAAILVGAATALIVAAGRAEGPRSPIFGVEVPAGYRQWSLVSVSHVPGFDELRAIVGNASAIDAARAGALPFPDGAILVKLGWIHAPSGDFPGAFAAGAPTSVQVMVKDRARYAATGGWGFGKFVDGRPVAAAEHAECFGCHDAHAKAHDFVFTRFAWTMVETATTLRRDTALDEALALTFPASDPVALTGAAPAPKIRVTRKSDAYWVVTIANPPFNIVGPAEVLELQAVVDRLEGDPRVQVVVFDSAVPDYFIAHYDLLTPLGASTGLPPGPTGMHPVPDLMVRLSRLDAVTIASIRGRASGIGSELALAVDMRFASREKAILSQFEVGAGFVPGGGPMARLPRLVGRGRALEILLGADDVDGALAERYGYVNRALPDGELDGFVDALATRIASFDRQTLIETKTLVNAASLPPDSAMQPEWDAFIASVQRPGAQARLGALIGKGLQKVADIERNLGHHTAAYRP